MSTSGRSLVLTGLVGFVVQTGCMTYKPVAPATVADHEEIRIATTDGRSEFLWEPQIRSDTLIGLRASGDTLRVALERLRTVEASGTDALKTAGLIVGIGAIVGSAWFIVSMAAMLEEFADS